MYIHLRLRKILVKKNVFPGRDWYCVLLVVWPVVLYRSDTKNDTAKMVLFSLFLAVTIFNGFASLTKVDAGSFPTGERIFFIKISRMGMSIDLTHTV